MRRALATVSVSATLAASAVIFADPALACSCASRTVDSVLAAGGAAAVITRTDDGSRTTAELRVERSLGPTLPGTLPGPEEVPGASCGLGVSPGAISAVAVHRREGQWSVGVCSYLPLGEVLQRADGNPRPVPGGPTVAFAAGAFGGSRVAALDDAGRVVAWDGRAGAAERVAVCPGGRKVVAAGNNQGRTEADFVPDLTVLDARTLAVERTTQIPPGQWGALVDLRCADPDGNQVEALVSDYNDGVGRILVATAEGTRARRLDNFQTGQATDLGFVVALGKDRTRLVDVPATGARATLTELAVPVSALAASADARHLAVLVKDEALERYLVFSYDLAGARIGEWGDRGTSPGAMTWTAEGLLVRDQPPEAGSAATLRLFDPQLRELRAWPAPASVYSGAPLLTAGSALIQVEGRRLTVHPEAGTPLIADDLRLVGAQHVAVIPGQSFAVSAATSSAAPSAPRSSGENSFRNATPWILGGAALLTAALALGVAVVRRQREDT